MPERYRALVDPAAGSGLHQGEVFGLAVDAGESIKALSECLGHHDSGFALRTYAHLMPSSETSYTFGRRHSSGRLGCR